MGCLGFLLQDFPNSKEIARILACPRKVNPSFFPIGKNHTKSETYLRWLNDRSIGPVKALQLFGVSKLLYNFEYCDSMGVILSFRQGLVRIYGPGLYSVLITKKQRSVETRSLEIW
jgi:hypothetical protein